MQSLNCISPDRPHLDKGFDLRFNVALRLETAQQEALETVGGRFWLPEGSFGDCEGPEGSGALGLRVVLQGST